MSMKLRSSIRKRNTRLRIDDPLELSYNYNENTSPLSSSISPRSSISPLLSSSSSDNEECIENNNEIPELEITDLINLANQLVRNNIPNQTTTINNHENREGEGQNQDNNNISNVHIRFPLIRSITEARDVILEYERQNESININPNDVIWESIIEDDSGISISGTRRNNNTNNINHDTNNDTRESLTSTSTSTNEVESRRQPFWLEIAGLITVTMFMFAVYRLVTTLVSIAAFSDNVLSDVVEFVEFVNEGTYYKQDNSTYDTLVKKFAIIIKDEMPFLPDTLWLAITVAIFSGYTILTSGIVLTSMLFSMMCLSMCCVIRWRHLGDFIMRVIDGN